MQFLAESYSIFNPSLVADFRSRSWLHNGQKDRTQNLVVRRSKPPFGRTTIKKTDS